MLKLLLLVKALGIVTSFGGTVDYAQDVHHYAYPPHPYYTQFSPDGLQTQGPAYNLDEVARDPPQVENHQIHDRFGGLFAPPFPGGTFGVGLGGPPGGYDPPPPLPPGLPSGFGPGPPPNGPIGPPPFGFPDPGFQTQTGFEGLLVPNSWYGLLPWGIEGVIIVIAGIIVFSIIVIAIIGLLAWFCGVKTVLPILKSDDESAEARSRFGDQWADSLVDLSANVMDAIEKFNEVTSEESDKEEEPKKKH